MSKTLYEIIGVSRDADTKTIGTRCLELGKQYNPKNNPDDLEAAIIYKDILTAYAVLRDPVKRAEYDANLGQAKSIVIADETIPNHTSTLVNNSNNCIDCGSSNVQRLSIIHSSGITNVDLTSKGSSVGIGGAHVIGGGNAIGVGLSKNKNKISGVQQTELSKLATPPKNVIPTVALPTSQWAVGLAGLAAFGIFHVFDNEFTIISFIVACVVALVVFAITNELFADKSDKQIALFKKETRVIQNQDTQLKWKNNYMCLACGNVYETPTDAANRSVQTKSKLDAIELSAQQSINKKQDISNGDNKSPRKVSIALMLGAIFLPIIFCWFLLRRGYSQRVHLAAIVWLAIFSFKLISNIYTSPSANVSEPSIKPAVVETPKADDDVQIAKKDGTVDPRPNDLVELCKDHTFYEQQILVKSRKGDEAGAADARVSLSNVNDCISAYRDDDVAKICAKF